MDLELFYGLVRVIIVLAILAPAVYFVTRWYGRRQIRGKSIHIEEVVPLGANKALYVVQWEGRRYLLGVSPHAINLIDTTTRQSLNGEEPE